ncbi:MAG: hypothetical protein AABY22_24065 [Nanoarchaeota archaeon]
MKSNLTKNYISFCEWKLSHNKCRRAYKRTRTQLGWEFHPGDVVYTTKLNDLNNRIPWKIFRKFGPTIIRQNIFGEKSLLIWWTKNKKHHRTDGPCIIYFMNDGTLMKNWNYMGVHQTEQEYWNL